MANTMIFLALIVAIGITHGRYLLIQMDQDTTLARREGPPTYKVIFSSDRRTCHNGYQIDSKPDYPQSRCEEQCTSNDDCQFYFTGYDPEHQYMWCILYSSCSEDQVRSLTGTTYEKLAYECKTIGGNQPNRKCVFPFSYDYIVYESCITVDHDTPWCSTEVHSGGNTKYGAWGNCAEGCRVTAEGWTGPTANIWDDSQCQNLGSYANFGNDLHQCQQACSAITECSAINYNPGHDCVLRGCSKPVPTPSSNWGNYVGYSMAVVGQ